MNGWPTVAFIAFLFVYAWVIGLLEKRYGKGAWYNFSLILILLVILLFAYVKGTNFWR